MPRIHFPKRLAAVWDSKNWSTLSDIPFFKNFAKEDDNPNFNRFVAFFGKLRRFHIRIQDNPDLMKGSPPEACLKKKVLKFLTTSGIKEEVLGRVFECLQQNKLVPDFSKSFNQDETSKHSTKFCPLLCRMNFGTISVWIPNYFQRLQKGLLGILRETELGKKELVRDDLEQGEELNLLHESYSKLSEDERAEVKKKFNELWVDLCVEVDCMRMGFTKEEFLKRGSSANTISIYRNFHDLEWAIKKCKGADSQMFAFAVGIVTDEQGYIVSSDDEGVESEDEEEDAGEE